MFLRNVSPEEVDSFDSKTSLCLLIKIRYVTSVQTKQINQKLNGMDATSLPMNSRIRYPDIKRSTSNIGMNFNPAE